MLARLLSHLLRPPLPAWARRWVLGRLARGLQRPKPRLNPLLYVPADGQLYRCRMSPGGQRITGIVERPTATQLLIRQF